MRTYVLYVETICWNKRWKQWDKKTWNGESQHDVEKELSSASAESIELKTIMNSTWNKQRHYFYPNTLLGINRCMFSCWLILPSMILSDFFKSRLVSFQVSFTRCRKVYLACGFVSLLFLESESLFILNNHHPSYLWARTAWWNTRKKCFFLSLLHPYRSHPIQQLHSCVHCEHRVKEEGNLFILLTFLSVYGSI